MKQKTDITDLFRAKLGDNLFVGDKLLDIRREAESIGRMAKRQVSEDGEFAKVYAESIGDWMDKIANIAEEAVSLLIENQEKGESE